MRKSSFIRQVGRPKKSGRYHINSPAFETAATNVGEDIHDMPGSKIGYVHPNSDVIRVRTAGAVVGDMVAICCNQEKIIAVIKKK
jgi:hypothetical protein